MSGPWRTLRLRRALSGCVLSALAAVALSAAAVSAPLGLASRSYADPLLSQVVIRWRCDRSADGNVVYEGYIDARPRGTAATIVEGRMWLGPSGLPESELQTGSEQSEHRFSPATQVPDGPAGSFNLTPFRIVRGASSCSEPRSIYWRPLRGAAARSAAPLRESSTASAAHEFRLR